MPCRFSLAPATGSPDVPGPEELRAMLNVVPQPDSGGGLFEQMMQSPLELNLKDVEVTLK